MCRFQARHGLNQTGAMNVHRPGVNVRRTCGLRQLELNAVRLRSYSGNLGERYVIVNIRRRSRSRRDGDHVATRHPPPPPASQDRPPVADHERKIQEVNFNPYWTVPASIIKKDLIPKMQKDPAYLTDNKIRRIQRGDREIPPSQVNWHSDEATRYRFRQDPGVDLNSMGFVRINIPNPHGVYMHDTPAKGIFGDDFRFVSSGCVRVQNVREYVSWICRAPPTPTRTRSRRSSRAASGSMPDRWRRSRSTGPIHHRLVDPGRPRAVPRRHLQRDGAGAPPHSRWAAARRGPRNFNPDAPDDDQTN